MHLQVYNVNRVSLDARLLYQGRYWGVFGGTGRRKGNQAISFFEEVPVLLNSSFLYFYLKFTRGQFNPTYFTATNFSYIHVSSKA